MSAASDELAAAQAALLALYAGNTQEIGQHDRRRMFLDMGKLQKRIDLLTWQVARENNGTWFAANMRCPE
jgi:hypothetical protein